MSSIITKMQKHPKQKFHRRWSLNPNCYVFHYKSRKITFWDLKKKKNSLWTFILKTASKICHLKSTLLYGFNSTPVSSSVHGSLRRLAQELWSYQGSCPPRSQTYHTDGCKPCKTKNKKEEKESIFRTIWSLWAFGFHDDHSIWKRFFRFMRLTHLEANMFQAFLTMSSKGPSRAWLLLTSVADFSYLLKGMGDFHALKASAGESQGV